MFFSHVDLTSQQMHLGNVDVDLDEGGDDPEALLQGSKGGEHGLSKRGASAGRGQGQSFWGGGGGKQHSGWGTMEDDMRSEAGWSEASNSDRALFSILSNSARIDAASLPRLKPLVEERAASPSPHRRDLARRIVSAPSRDVARSDRSAAGGDESPQRCQLRADVRRPSADHSSLPRPRPPSPILPSQTAPPPPLLPTFSNLLSSSTSLRLVSPWRTLPPCDLPFATRVNRSPDTKRRCVAPLPTGPHSMLARTEGGATTPSRRWSVSDEDDEFTKRTILNDLRQMESQGLRLTKEWSMSDRVEDMMLEVRKLSLAQDETSQRVDDERWASFGG